MTTKQSTPVTIIKQDNTILIAKHNPQLPLGEILQGHFPKDPVSQQIDKEGVRAFGDDTYVPTEQGEQCTWHNLFCNDTVKQVRMIWKENSANWKDIDTKWSNGITQFKQDNILSIGDIRVRSVLMAFSSAVLYKTISWNTTGLLRKTRNLGVSFALMGYLFVPELFNPFLQKRNLNKIK